MHPSRQASVAVALIVITLAVIYSAKRYRLNQEYDRTHPLSVIAGKIDAAPGREWCDEQTAVRRKFVAAVVDRYRAQIADLWKGREQAPALAVPTIPLGRIQLRVSAAQKPTLPALEYDDSAWGWEEVYGMIQKTQNDFLDSTQLRSTWRDVDSMTSFLLEKDYARTTLGRKFEPPNETKHQFRPNTSVERTGKKEFSVTLDPGEFKGFEKVLSDLLEAEWKGEGFHVKVRWAPGDPTAYRFEANLRSGRTYVNHTRRAIVLENLAWTKVLAHEFGHVLGFDDHYYSVWNAQNCYYTQLARNSDLMSSSEKGSVGRKHWDLLDQAYPWKKNAAATFAYVFASGAGQGDHVGDGRLRR